MPASSVRSPLATVVTVATIVAVELIRASGPMLDLAFGVGVEAAAGAALVAYLLAGVVAAVLVLAARRRSAGSLLLTGAVVLAVARLAVQALGGWARFGVGLVAVAVALALLTLAVAVLAARPEGGRAAAAAVANGAAGAVGLTLILGTWDAVWRPGLTGWIVALALAGAVVWSARRAAGTAAPSARPTRLWALGPVLGLGAMALINPAFAASQSGLPLAVAGAAVALGPIAAALLVGRTAGPAWPASLALPAALTLVYLVDLPGVVVLALIVVAQIAAFVALGAALGPRPGRFRPGRVAGSAALVGLGTIAPILVFQLDYDVPLGFPNALAPIAAAALLGAAGLRPGGHRIGRTSTTLPGVTPAGADPVRRPRRVMTGPGGALTLVVAGVLVAAGGALTTYLASGPSDDPGPPGRVTLVSWNLHYGVGADGDVDLEALAATISEQDACVVLLQEVSRGWVLGGGADMATWLANRLGMRMEFAPAADAQFGNAILSCTPAEHVVVHDLPYGAGPQNRSALSADVTVGGVTERYTTVHLQHRESNTPTRLDQLAALTSAGDLGILAGDFNAEPGWEEILALVDQGWVSAQDTVGDPDARTSPASDPRYRIDWVFVPERLTGALRDLTVLDTTASDHRPLVLQLEVD